MDNQQINLSFFQKHDRKIKIISFCFVLLAALYFVFLYGGQVSCDKSGGVYHKNMVCVIPEQLEYCKGERGETIKVSNIKDNSYGLS